ncbi:cytochrome b-245 chaperone 1-like isoform X2 [Homarus americanus]|uniref:Essential for reactive oxygen species protein n=1 Tax=Homarus americanus TaxID=6706 RepID=A0A8J5NBL1_HOMAM|nr:cytochrome b-245 chaperone 1-like isoform X2 [Homarus americanus]KAG7176263.1 Cytochrome b-245 chaperone 1-like [Homarus americanus]
MNVALSSREVLHLSVGPGVKSWSIFVDEHILMKIAYLTGCLILGLTFLDDWEDCVFDKTKGLVTMTRRNWFEWLTSRCADHNTLVLDTSSVMTVRVVHGSGRLKDGYQVALVLRAGGTVPLSETSIGLKSDQEQLASSVRSFLSLDRVEAVRNTWTDWTESDEEDFLFVYQPPVEVESLKGSGNLNFEEVKQENENNLPEYHRNDTDSSSEEELFDVL